MPVINVSIVRRDDPPPWSDAKEIAHLPDQPWLLAGLEGGMSSGKPSIALRLELSDGQSVIAETSIAAWIAATCALRGAFPEVFIGTPLA